MMGGLPLNDKVWNSLLKEVDKNGDGMVYFTYQIYFNKIILLLVMFLYKNYIIFLNCFKYL